MEFVEYFNLLNSGYKSFSFSIVGIIFIIIGIVSIFFILRFKKKVTILVRRWKAMLIFMCLWTVFAVFWVGLSLSSTFSEYLELRGVLLNNEYKVVEGYVDSYHPMPYAGHEHETFTVQGVNFSYSDYEVTNAFNNIISLSV